MRINPEHVISPILAETRKAILSNAPDGLTKDEKEVWWMVNWIQWKQEASKIPGFKIADPGEAEKLRRKLPGLQKSAIEECREAIQTLTSHLNEKSTLDDYPMGPILWAVSDEAANEIDRCLSTLDSFIDRLEARRNKPTKPSRTPETKAMYIRSFWPLLSEEGFSMRRASKVLSRVFLLSGITDHEQDSNIYQTIRNLSI